MRRAGSVRVDSGGQMSGRGDDASAFPRSQKCCPMVLQLYCIWGRKPSRKRNPWRGIGLRQCHEAYRHDKHHPHPPRRVSVFMSYPPRDFLSPSGVRFFPAFPAGFVTPQPRAVLDNSLSALGFRGHLPCRRNRHGLLQVLLRKRLPAGRMLRLPRSLLQRSRYLLRPVRLQGLLRGAPCLLRCGVRPGVLPRGRCLLWRGLLPREPGMLRRRLLQRRPVLL